MRWLDGWMASLTRWTRVWVNSGSWWWTGRPGVLRFMGSQRVGHDWTTELNWTEGWSGGVCKLHIGWDLCWVFVCLFVLPLMGKAEWGGTPVYWWLSLYFCFVCFVDETSYTGCYCQLGNIGSCIQEVSFVWVLTIWYSLGLVLQWSRVLESVLPFQRLRAWSLVRNKDSTSGLLRH